MAQHDYNLSNNTGALYRADNNAALQAIVTQNSGATAPSVTFPGMLWLDISGGGDGIMRRRNQANTAWLADIGIDQTARDAAAAAAATANAAMPKAGGTFTGPINLVGTEPTNNQAVSRAQADLLYQVRLPTAGAGTLLYGAAGGWTNVLAPAANDTLLVLSGGLPTWQTGAVTAQPNSYVRTRSDGTIDASLIPAVATGLRFRGTFRPAVNAEYPTTGGSGAAGAPATGDFWVIDGLTTGGFTYLTGSLAGVTVYNGDSIAKSEGAQWYRMGSVIEVEGYLPIDGSGSMAGNLNMAAHTIINVGGIVARSGSPVPLNNFSIDATNVVISPQRGTTGPELPALATGQLATDIGRFQIVVGAGGSNLQMLAVLKFSTTSNYAAGTHVIEAGQMYKSATGIAAGAFIPSQWRRMIDSSGAQFDGVVTVNDRLVLGPAGGEGGEIVLRGNPDTVSDSVIDSAGELTRFFGGPAVPITFNRTNGEVRGVSRVFTGAGLEIAVPGSSERTVEWKLTDRSVYLYANDTNKVFGLYDTGAGISRFSTTPAGDMEVRGKFACGGAALGTTVYTTLACGGGIISKGGAASFNLEERGGGVNPWSMYAVSGVLRFLREGQGDRMTVDQAGAVVATSFNPISDARMKSNVTQVAARDLSAAGLATFVFDQTDEPGRAPIAQDVQAVAPEYVTEFETEDGPRLAVNLAALAYEIALNAAERVAALEAAAQPAPAVH